MSSSSSSATATATDAQTWVYPPPGVSTPPVTATSNFGPVHLNDRMVLQWTPSTIPDEILYYCISESGEGSQWIAAQNIGQPFTYEFKHKASQRNTSDSIFCHFYFFPSVMGNTVVFQYKNEPAAEIATWQGPSAPTYVSKTVTSAVTTSTGTPTSPPSGTSTSSSSSTASPSSTSTTSPASGGGLSTGASAGIGVGVAVGVLALAAAAFFFWRSRQNKRAQDSQWDRPPPSQDVSYSPPPQDFSYKYAQQTTSPAATFGGEMQGSPPPVELRGSTPEHELHSSNLKRG